MLSASFFFSSSPMDSLTTTKVSLSLFCFCILLSFSAIPNSALALEDCGFPAIFNFGDSNSDTGGYAATFGAPTPPYGETFFHHPVGRFCDGRLMIDFLAQNLSLPFLSAYLNSLGTKFSHGANFAEAAATVTPQTSIVPNGGFSPFDLDVQYDQFMEFKNKSRQIRELGGIYGDLMPREEYFLKALYTFDIGHNDLAAELFANKTIAEVNASIPDIINTYSTAIKNVYNSGARSFWIQNTDPMGCLPYILTSFPVTEFDSAGCAKDYNGLSQYFNQKLKEEVVQLRKDLPLATFVYVDVYSVKYSIFTDPQKYGFELPFVACCGYGGKYNYGTVFCGQTGTVNGTQIFAGSCKNPMVRVNWDGVHYTEAANKFVFNHISTGEFSDPPVPLRMACHNSSN